MGWPNFYVCQFCLGHLHIIIVAIISFDYTFIHSAFQGKVIIDFCKIFDNKEECNIEKSKFMVM